MTEKKCVNLGTPQTYMFFQEEKSGSKSALSFVCSFPYLKLSKDVPSGPVVKTELPVQRVQGHSLLGELNPTSFGAKKVRANEDIPR